MIAVQQDINNDTVRVIFQEEGYERCYTLTPEGLIIDVIRDGEVINSKCFGHDLVSEDPDDIEDDKKHLALNHLSVFSDDEEILW